MAKRDDDVSPQIRRTRKQHLRAPIPDSADHVSHAPGTGHISSDRPVQPFVCCAFAPRVVGTQSITTELDNHWQFFWAPRIPWDLVVWTDRHRVMVYSGSASSFIRIYDTPESARTRPSLPCVQPMRLGIGFFPIQPPQVFVMFVR